MAAPAGSVFLGFQRPNFRPADLLQKNRWNGNVTYHPLNVDGKSRHSKPKSLNREAVSVWCYRFGSWVVRQ